MPLTYLKATQVDSTSSLTVAAATVSGSLTYGSQTGIAAAGSTQAAATALTKTVNIVSTSTAVSAIGVRLMTAAAGLVIYVVNASANAITIYPATGANIDTLAANAGFTLGAGGKLAIVGSSATQWYSMTAVYG
jgi:hypothetical protein